MNKTSLILILLLISNASALIYTQTTKNSHTFALLEGVTVEVYNSTGDLYASNVTDDTGYSKFTLPEDIYNITSYKDGYNTDYRVEVNLTANLDGFTYLYRISEPLIKFIYTDITLGTHQICFYGRESGRLIDCYTTNDTITLASGNYSVYVKSTITDSAANPTTIVSLIKQLVPFLLVVVLIGGFLILAVGFVWMAVRRMR